MANPIETVPLPTRDAQAETPATRVSLSRVGVVGVEKIIRVCGTQNGGEAGDASLYHADLECFVDLNPEQAGVHMSRFEEVVNEAIDTVVLGEALRAEGLAAHIAERVRERQGGLRAEVRIAARYPETVPAPVSGSPTQELYTLFGTAVSSERGTRTLIGVEAQGMTACPEDSDVDVDARQLLRIVESSMSSEIYELMKRSDERHVVEKAHSNPRF